MRVSGPSEAMKGDQLNFECSTSDSNPPVDIWWVVDGRAVQVRLRSATLLAQSAIKYTIFANLIGKTLLI